MKGERLCRMRDTLEHSGGLRQLTLMHHVSLRLFSHMASLALRPSKTLDIDLPNDPGSIRTADEIFHRDLLNQYSK